MFCTICAPQIEREIAMCCRKVSVINLVSKWRDGRRRETYKERQSVFWKNTFSVTTNLRNNEQFQWCTFQKALRTSQTNHLKWDSLSRWLYTGLGVKQQHHSEDEKTHLITCPFLEVKADGGVSAQLWSPFKSWFHCAVRVKTLAQAFLSLYCKLLSVIPVIYEQNEWKDAASKKKADTIQGGFPYILMFTYIYFSLIIFMLFLRNRCMA